MKILVTGSSGFIATKLVERLKGMRHEVADFDIITGQDLLNRDELETYIKDADVVYHLAAQADLTKMMKDLDGGLFGATLNIEGTHNVAYLCAKHNKWLIYASTLCVYGNQETFPEHEDKNLPAPPELYACSKYAGEWIVKGYGYNFDNPFTILRFATIYGEGMREALGMHIFFRQAMAGDAITVHGDGLQDRTLTYIDDLVDGIVAPLANKEASNQQIFNLSSPMPVSALQMAEDVREITQSDSPIVFIEQRKNQTFHEHIDVSKAKELLGWEAKTPWKEGLTKTLEWMKTQ